MKRRLLLVEDDTVLRTTLADALEQEGYEVVLAEDGRVASEIIFSRHVDAVLLDLMLPHRGGLEILREMRSEGLETPVLVLTVRGDENDKVLGLELGADDYVTKPFSLREVLARLKALLRRSEGKVTQAETIAPRCFSVGGATVDLARYEIVRGSETHTLSPTEARILELLHAEEGGIVTRERFLSSVWGEGDAVSQRTVDTHILHVRGKLEENPREPRHLVTVHGVGYRLLV